MRISRMSIALVATLVTAIPAHADNGPAGDNPEDNYLYILADDGIHPANDSEAVALGYEICDDIASGMMPRKAMAKLDASTPRLNAEQAETVVDSAVAWLCPEYIGQYLANR